jgi:RND family efflux transporter MFP subunit
MYKSFIYLLILFAGFSACKKNYISEANIAEDNIKRVKVLQIEATQEPIPVYASGILASKAESNLSFKTGGIIAKILVDEGDYFKAGQLLAELELTEIQSQVTQARNNYEKARRDVRRINNLFEENAATLEQVQDLNTALEVAEANLRIATFNLRYSRIIAQEDGKVLNRYAETGEVISSGKSVLQVGTTGADHFIMKIGVSDKDIIRLQANDSALVQFDPYNGIGFPAYVSDIHESADLRTGTFEVELTLLPTPYELKNGFVGKIVIYPSRQQGYYKIPMTALIDGSRAGASVFLYDPGIRQSIKATVKPFYVDDDHFFVYDDALKPPVSVITEGAAYLSNGENVQPL